MYAKRAFQVAKKAHEGQKDKAGVDYIYHPIKVASMMDTDIEKAVAYLHDVIEDTSMTIEDLSQYGFPNVVIQAVDVLTKRNEESYDLYIQRVIQNSLAKKVKMADLMHNSDITRIQNPTAEDIERCKKYKRKLIELSATQ